MLRFVACLFLCVLIGTSSALAQKEGSAPSRYDHVPVEPEPVTSHPPARQRLTLYITDNNNQYLDPSSITVTSTTTDTDYPAERSNTGVYFVQLPPGSYRIRVKAAQFYTKKVSVTLESIPNTTIISLSPYPIMTIRPLDSSGNLLANATITAVDSSGNQFAVPLAQDGSAAISLPNDTYQVTVHVDGYTDQTQSVVVGLYNVSTDFTMSSI